MVPFSRQCFAMPSNCSWLAKDRLHQMFDGVPTVENTVTLREVYMKKDYMAYSGYVFPPADRAAALIIRTSDELRAFHSEVDHWACQAEIVSGFSPRVFDLEVFKSRFAGLGFGNNFPREWKGPSVALWSDSAVVSVTSVPFEAGDVGDEDAVPDFDSDAGSEHSDDSGESDNSFDSGKTLLSVYRPIPGLKGRTPHGTMDKWIEFQASAAVNLHAVATAATAWVAWNEKWKARMSQGAQGSPSENAMAQVQAWAEQQAQHTTEALGWLVWAKAAQQGHAAILGREQDQAAHFARHPSQVRLWATQKAQVVDRYFKLNPSQFEAWSARYGPATATSPTGNVE
jgi:hypothetical protein